MASNKNKLAFLSMPAPASYVAGLGRGASGFTTRSDIGPAREGPSAEVIAEAQARRGEEPDVDPEQFQDPDNEPDDEEADKIYDDVDRTMDSRRRARREAREEAELAKHRAERPKLQQQFAGSKTRACSSKRRRDERTFAVPDSIVVGDRSKGEYENALDSRQQEQGGFETPADSGVLTNFVEIGQARDKVLSLKLDQVSGTTSTSGLATSIDPKGYLTSLESQVIKTEAEIGDIKRARMLFDSLIKSNPKHAPGWIAAAALEEHAGRMVAARKLIKQGCEQCPKSEDIWLEAARLHQNDDAKVILANAVQHVGQSVKVWLAAADLENDAKARKRVLRRALEHIPNSVRLWKETVNLETSPADARTLLSRAVEVIPLSVELWLALARLESPENAKAVLNKARKAVPTSHEIWIAAGRLIEQEAYAAVDSSEEKRAEELERVDKTLVAAVRALRAHGVLLTREQWLKEAERCEAEGAPRTCEAIVSATVAMEVEEEDRLATWLGDAEAAEARGRVGTARAVLAYALRVFPDRRDLWRRAADLEKAHGTRESLDKLLARAVECCPQAEVLWLMWAKEKWLGGDVPVAREVLERAFVKNSESEQIWLAAVKLEAENGELAVARELLVRARTVADTERIWMKSAVFERQQGQAELALKTVSTALSKYPKFAKLYMIQGQIHQAAKDYSVARAAYAAGLKAVPKDITLGCLPRGWSTRRATCSGQEAVGIEERSGASAQAKALLARALQECPSSGVLWRGAWTALKKCADDALVICTVARLFWAERKIDKARQWFERAIGANPDVGDAQAEDVAARCTAAEPHHGATWQAIAKDDANRGRSTRELLELVTAALQ
ncbi:PRP1 splicing factor, N-terminal-domain-containing protein [Lactarius sanguifluus]|nr:PRP1 splicing factor, N-terminal-domain-containing protein [Lactarius sanguifluus]